MPQVSSRYSNHFGRVCCGSVLDSVSLRFEFSFMNGSSFKPTLGFWSRMLGCVPDTVSLRFEFSFMNGSSFAVLGSFWSCMLRGSFQIQFRYVSNLVSCLGQVSSRYSDFGRVCYVVAFQIRFRYVSNLVHEWLKFRAVLGSFWCCYRKTGTATSSLMCEAAACLNA